MPRPKTFPRAPRWANGKVFSLRLRDGHYAVLQMLPRKGHIAVFSHFRDADSWGDLQLEASAVLFFTTATTAFFRRSSIRRLQEVAPVAGLEDPPPHIPKIHPGSDWRELTFWPGTPDERTVLTIGTGKNSLVAWTREEGEIREHRMSLSPSDYEDVAATELTGLSDYPNLNERILLCRTFGRSFDPEKEIAFDRPLPLECRTYIDVIGGKVRLSELGY